MIDVLMRHQPNAPALVDPERGREICYGELVDRVGYLAALVRRELGHGLVFHVATNTVESIIVYLGCLEAMSPLCLLEPGPAARLTPLLGTYAPEALLFPAGEEEMPQGFVDASDVIGEGENAYRLGRSLNAVPKSLHPSLALLLTTSGSPGSPKLARLTKANILANARSIASYLAIGPGERAIQSLPMHYSFGLSVINSHLVAGATVVLTRHSFMRPEFWDTFNAAACTSIAGVPYVYETLHRLRFDPGRHPSLKTMTQAGGPLRRDLIQAFHERAVLSGCRFFVMYGQTEATARIAYVPPERLATKIGSIGVPIPDGALSLASVEDVDGDELVYQGPNVMMGYAESIADLGVGDMLGGVLRTGDLAKRDDDGFFFLTGRLKRFAKLFGRRVNLEDVERDVEQRYPVHAAVVEGREGLRVYAERQGAVDLSEIAFYLAERFNVPPKFIAAEPIGAIPLTASGKKNYRALPA